MAAAEGIETDAGAEPANDAMPARGGCSRRPTCQTIPVHTKPQRVPAITTCLSAMVMAAAAFTEYYGIGGER